MVPSTRERPPAFPPPDRPEPPSPASPPPARRRRGWLARVGLVALVVVAAALVVVAVTRIGPGRIGHALVSVTPGWIVAALALMATSLLLRAESWHAVLHAALPEHRLARTAVTRATMVGVMTSAALPGRLGEPARAVLVARRVGDRRRTLPVIAGTIFSQTLINLFALLVLAAATLASVSVLHGSVGAVGAALAVPLALATAIVAGPRALRFAARHPAPWIHHPAAWTALQVERVRQGMSVFRRRREGAWAVATQLGAWGLQTVACYAVVLAFHLHVGVQAAAAVLLAVNVTAAVPVTPSNVGVFQAACVAVLAAYGVPAGRGLAYGIVLQAVEVVTALGVGVPALVGEGVSFGDLRTMAARAVRRGAAPEEADPDGAGETS